jgi:hypothetical protein
MDWRECLGKKIAKRISVDVNLINSLIETSRNKLISEEKLILDEITAGSKISLAYDSLRELLEALAIKNEFKIYNPEAFTPFLKEVLNKQELGEKFDEIRKIRNSINYYGKSVLPEEAKQIIVEIKLLKEEINHLIK